jgi:hypothetical protein
MFQLLRPAVPTTHITHVLTKLGVRDRVRVVIYAYETGVVEPDDNRV